MAKKLKEEGAKQQKKDDKTKGTSSTTNNSKHEGGLVLADKIFEPSHTLMMAYKSRLKFGNTLETQWDEYLDLKLEKRRLAICKQLIEVT